MNSLLSILILFVITATGIFAQSIDTSHSDATIGLSLGPSHTQINDRIISPIRSDGFITSGSITYQVHPAQSQHRVTVGGSFGQITNRYDLPAAVGSLHLGYRYLHRIGNDILQRLTYHVGGSLTASTAVQFYYLLDESHIYWLTAHELAATGTATWTVGTSSNVTAELGIPLLALLSRPPEQRYYNNDKPEIGEILDLVHQDLHLTSPADYLGFNLSLSYNFGISERLDESITYLASYRYSSDPLRGEFLSHTVQLSLLYHL